MVVMPDECVRELVDERLDLAVEVKAGGGDVDDDPLGVELVEAVRAAGDRCDGHRGADRCGERA